MDVSNSDFKEAMDDLEREKLEKGNKGHDEKTQNEDKEDKEPKQWVNKRKGKDTTSSSLGEGPLQKLPQRNSSVGEEEEDKDMKVSVNEESVTEEWKLILMRNSWGKQ